MSCLRSVMVGTVAALAWPASMLAQGGGGGGQPPQQQQPPKNLQVLPKDMPRPEVVARMRAIAGALGVRCEYCHVAVQGPDGREQVQDYSLDDKDTKKTARSMLRMVADINDKYMPDMGRTLTALTQVSCETCHHGLSKPRTVQAELAGAVEAKGADSAIALYRDLRVRYFGRAAYDFGENALTNVSAYQQLPNGRQAGIALLRLNLEFFPQSVPTFTALAQQLVQAGDTAGAVEALTKAVAVQPDNPQIKGMLNRLKPQKP